MKSAFEIAQAVRRSEIRAVDVLSELRPVIENANGALVAFVHLDWELARSGWQGTSLRHPCSQPFLLR